MNQAIAAAPATETRTLTPATAALDLVADHLNAALAHGEAMLAMRLDVPAAVAAGSTVPAILRQNRDIAGYIKGVRALELAITARLMQALRCIGDAKRYDRTLSPLLRLIESGTAPLADHAKTLSASEPEAYDTAGHASAFLRSRRLVASNAAGLEHVDTLVVGEDCLVHGIIPLGTLMDFCAAALDAIDALPS